MAARTSTLYNADLIEDFDGTLFQGFLAVAVVPGQMLTYPYQYSVIRNTIPPQRLPAWYWVRITNGLIDTSQRLFVTEDLLPSTAYVAYIFDTYRHEVPLQFGGARFALTFQLTDSPYNIVVPTLKAPTSGTTPVPQST